MMDGEMLNVWGMLSSKMSLRLADKRPGALRVYQGPCPRVQVSFDMLGSREWILD